MCHCGWNRVAVIKGIVEMWSFYHDIVFRFAPHIKLASCTADLVNRQRRKCTIMVSSGIYIYTQRIVESLQLIIMVCQLCCQVVLPFFTPLSPKPSNIIVNMLYGATCNFLFIALKIINRCGSEIKWRWKI